MSLKIDRVQLDIIIKGDETRKQLRMIEEDMSKIRKEMKRLPEGSKEWKELDAQLKKLKSTHDGLIEKIGLTGLTMKELQQRAKELRAVLQQLSPKTKEFAEYQAQLKAVSARMGELSGKAQATGLSLGKIGDGFNRYFTMVTAFVAAFAGIVIGIRKAIDMANEFEQSLANLSALTGLVGDDLKWLGEKAKELSVSTTDSGVRITKSAVDILEGFKLMGSARPDLLKNKEALAQVTENALILAEASTIEMKPAVDAVAASMNQFNLGADQSARIINALGAGSLAGSAEVADLTESMANVGTVAANSNMTLEQTIGVIETLGEKQLKGAEAGTQLKTTLISLKAAGLGYTSGVFNMRDAIVQLKAKIDAKSTALEKDTVLIDTFGKRNITVGTILVNSIDKYDSFTKAVTGTNTAFEQAIINTSTNGAKLEQAKNKAALYGIELGEKLTPIMTFSTNVMGKFLRLLSASIEFYVKHAWAVNTTVIAITAFTAAIKINQYWSKIETALMTAKAFAYGVLKGQITLATIATKAFSTASKGTVWGIIIAAIISVVSYFYSLESKILASTQAMLDFGKAVNTELRASNQLFEALKNTTEGTDSRKIAIDKVNEAYGKYLPHLLTEKSSLKEIEEAQKAANIALMQNVAIKSQETAVSDIMDKYADDIKSKTDAIIEYINDKSGASVAGIAQADFDETLNKYRNSLDKFGKKDATIIDAYAMKYGKNQRYEWFELFTEISTLYDKQQSELNKVNSFFTSYIKQVGGATSQSPEDLNKEGDVSFDKSMVFKGGQWVKNTDTKGDGNATLSDKEQKELEKQEKAKLKSEQTYYDELKKLRADDTIDKATKISEDYFDEVKRIEDLAKKEKWTVEEKGAVLKALAEKLNKDLAAVDAEYATNQIELNNAEFDNEAKTQEEIAALKKKGIEEQAVADKKAAEEKQKLIDDAKKKEEDALWEVANTVKEAIDFSSQYSAIKSNNRLKLYDKNQKKELSLVAGNKEQEEAINAKYEAIREAEQKKQFEKEKKLKIAEILINGAIESAKLWASTIYPFGVPASIIMQAVIVARVAGQTALVAAQEYAGGNFAEVIGAQTGKSYKNVPVEPIAQNRIYSRPTLVGGKLVGETGPELVLNPPTTRNLFMNYPAITRAIQTAYAPAYATGNMQNVAGQYNSNKTVNAAIDTSRMEALLTQLLKQSNNPVKAYMTMKDFKTVSDLQTEIENSVRR